MGADQGHQRVDPSGTIRVVIADDHSVVRRGLRQLLVDAPGFEVVAEAGDVETARRYVRGHRPDVLVLDLNMPGGSSLDAIPGIRTEFPDTQIVVLTMQNGCGYSRTSEECLLIGTFLRWRDGSGVRETRGYRDNPGFCAALAG